MITDWLTPVFKIFKFVTVATIFAVFLTLSACTTAPHKPVTPAKGDYQYLKDYLSWSIADKLKQHKVRGLSIAVVDDQKIVWAKGFGLADEANHLPASSQTVYRIGSLSKVITATEIMRLHQSGKINIDHPVSDYITDFSIKSRFDNTGPITLRALLSHHSGLPSDIIAGMWVQHPASLAELTHAISNESLASPPGTQYKYSNIGFSLLGRVIEIAENRPFSSAIGENLLQPLGMYSSAFELKALTEKRYAKGYRTGQEAERTPLRDLPAGSMLSNVDDMARFIRFVFSDGHTNDKNILNPETLAEMFTPQFANMPLDFGHKTGLGWMLSGLTQPVGEHIVWHNGAGTPHQAHISFLPDKKLGVVILANTDEASQFITGLGTKSLELALEAKFGKAVPAQEPPVDIIPVSLASEQLDEYAGAYVIFGNMTRIHHNGSKLELELDGNTLDLIPVSHDTFVPKAKVLGFISIPLLKFSLQFKTVNKNRIALLHGLPAPFAFQKVPEYRIPDAWINRLGSYQTDTSEEQFAIDKIQLKTENGILLFDVTIRARSENKRIERKIALTPVSDTAAIVTGLANGEGGTVRVVMNGDQENLYYSGFLLRPGHNDTRAPGSTQ